MRLFALRGANTVLDNDAAAILGATDELMRELMARNELVPDAMVSCIFTLTDDLNAEFPAVAARALGLSRVPLLCAARGARARLAAARDPRDGPLLRARGSRAAPRISRRGTRAPGDLESAQ